VTMQNAELDSRGVLSLIVREKGTVDAFKVHRLLLTSLNNKNEKLRIRYLTYFSLNAFCDLLW